MSYSLDSIQDTETPTLSLDTSSSTPPLSADVVASRAQKADLGLSSILNQTYNDFSADLISGKEQQLRSRAAAAADQQESARKMSIVQQIAANSPKELPLAMRMAKFDEKTDPDTVIESKYSQEFMKYFAQNLDTPPPGINQTMDEASDYATKTEYIRTQLENMRTFAENQGYLFKAATFATSLVPVLSTLQTQIPIRSLDIPGVKESKLALPSTYLEAQRQALVNMSVPEFKQVFDNAVKYLQQDAGRPDLAVEWATTMLGQSLSDKVMNNALPIIDVGGTALAGLGEATSLAKNILLYNTVRRQAQNMIRSMEIVGPETSAHVVAPAAAGDLTTAATRQAAETIISTAAGDTGRAARSAKEGLTSNFAADMNVRAQNPGRLGMTIVNRINESTQNLADKFIKTIADTINVERLPDILASNKVMSEYYEGVKDLYPGIRNTILDFSMPYRDPVTKKWMYDINFGNNRGDYFASFNDAKRWSDFQGFKDAIAISDRGAGTKFYVKLPRNLNETDPVLIKAAAELAETKTPQSSLRLFSSWLSKYRTPNETLAKNNIRNRLVATYAPSRLMALYKEQAQIIRNMSRGSSGKHSLPRLLSEVETPENRTAQYGNTITGFRTADNSTYTTLPEMSHGGGTTIRHVTIPPVEAGKIRFYHGGDNPGSGGGRWVSEDQNYARNYRQGETLHYIDIPEQWLKDNNINKSFDDTGTSQRAPYVHFEAPEQFAQQLQPVEGGRPRSDLTVFVNSKDAESLRNIGNNPRLILNNGSLSIAKPTPGKGFDITGGVDFSHTPTLGSHPVQLFSPSRLNNLPSFRNVHVGEKIQQIERNVTGEQYISPKKRWENWQTIVSHERDMPDLDNPGKFGYFFKSPGELEEHYLKTFHYLPNEQEIEAYFRYVDLNELDLEQRNLLEHKHISRLGGKTHTAYTFDENKSKIESPQFTGIRMKELPDTEDSLLYLTAEGKMRTYLEGTRYVQGGMGPPTHKALKDAVAEGKLSVVRIYDPDQYALREFTDSPARYRYVVTPNLSESDLPLQLIPRRGGGHVEYDYDHYIKQPSIVPHRLGDNADGTPRFRHGYEGDKTLMPISNRVLGNDVIKQINPIVKMMNASKDWTAARSAFEASKLPMSWSEFSSWFKPSKTVIDGKKTTIPPRFQTDQDFYLVPKNRSILDLNNDLPNKYANTWRDYTKGGSDAKQFRIQFTGERDAFNLSTVNNSGTRQQPVYSYDAANKVDPMVTLNRAVSRIAQSQYLEDYKISSIQSWLSEAKNFLKIAPGEAEHSPMWVFQKAEFLPGVNTATRNELETARMQIRELTQIPSTTDTFLHTMTQRAADSVYSASNVFTRTPLLLSHWALANSTNAARVLRSFTFNTVMGLFSPIQFLVQSAGWFTFMAVAPKSYLPASFGSLAHLWTRFNKAESTLQSLGRASEYFGWKPGQWRQAFDLMERSGFGIVGGEHVTAMDAFNNKIVRHGIQDFLESGQAFWRGGEKNVRWGSWYAAAHEHGLDNGFTGAWSSHQEQQILDRADLFSGNMTTASKSIMQKGLMEWPSQFLGYQTRLIELFTGKRLTVPEKARLFAMYSTVYGVPIATGLFGVFPFGDLIKKYGIDHGYVTGDSNWEWLMEGFPSALIDHITGQSFNIGQRYGAGGFTVARDILRGDKQWWDYLGGASFGRLASAVEYSDGFYRAMMSLIKTGKTTEFPFTSDLFIQPMMEAQSFSSGRRLLIALNTQKWITASGQTAEQIGPWRAAFQALTGLSSTQQSDLNLKYWTMSDREENQKWGLKMFLQRYGQALQALADNSNAQSQSYFMQAKHYLAAGGYPAEKYGQAVGIAANSHAGLIDRTNFDFYMKNLPPEQKEQALSTYERALKVERARGQQ